MTTTINKQVDQTGTELTERAVMVFNEDHKITSMKILSNVLTEDGNIEPHLDSDKGAGVHVLDSEQVEAMFNTPRVVYNAEGQEVELTGEMVYQWFGVNFDDVFADVFKKPETEPEPEQ